MADTQQAYDDFAGKIEELKNFAYTQSKKSDGTYKAQFHLWTISLDKLMHEVMHAAKGEFNSYGNK